MFEAIVAFFGREAAAGRITKSDLARRLDKDPGLISRGLSEPKNFEIDSISDLLLAMDADMDHTVVRFDEGDLHPLIKGLVQTLPKKENDKWPLDRRVHWLQIAVNIFSLLYGNADDGEIKISVVKRGVSD